MVEGGEADQKFSAGASSAPSNIAPVPVLTYQLPRSPYEKVAHLMKGIAEDLYQILSSQEYETTDAFVKRCRHIESLRRRRIVRPRFQRLPNVSAVSTETDADYLRSLLRTIVREELQKIMPEVQDYTDNETEKPRDIASVIQEEVMEALAPITGARRDKTTPQRSIPTRPQARRETTNRPTPQRRTDLWRTDNNVPLCYHCGRPGHVLRYCRERRRIFQNARATRTINPRRDVYADSLASYDDDYAQPTSSRIEAVHLITTFPQPPRVAITSTPFQSFSAPTR
ncbi:hypothetical protein HNY73_021834 [Argiope bruennichi]|uniref:CCHC-type domain-containing protein n=1 Tax=Argiope bruennichi TaxID=94029 RepID=A0A8T0DZV7_ARGBR|nr:hypothetical protein HNY73_021834 [Argiope bruennichi]